MQTIAALMLLLTTPASILGMCPTQCTCLNQTALCSSRWFRGIKQYEDLRELTIINTGLKSLDSSIFPSNLVMLSVRHNMMLAAIDKSTFVNLAQLKSIRISHNPDLTSVPVPLFLNNQKLTVLDLSFNNLQLMHYSTLMPLKNLVELRLQGNRFTSFDGAAFSHLMNLKKLRLDYNHIDYLPPNLFSAMFNLEELYLNNNNLVSLHERLFSSMTELRVLDLSFNFLDIFPTSLFQSQIHLVQLSLSWNYLKRVPSLMPAFKSLKELKMDGNELRHLSSEMFGSFKNLNSVNISANYLLQCDSELNLFLEWCRENGVQVSPKASCRHPTTKVSTYLDVFYKQSTVSVTSLCILFVIIILLMLRLILDVFLNLCCVPQDERCVYPRITFFRANMADTNPLESSKTPPLVSYKQEEEGGVHGEPEYEYIDMSQVKTISVKNVNYYEVPLTQPQHSVDKSPPLKLPRKKAPSPPVSFNEYS